MSVIKTAKYVKSLYLHFNREAQYNHFAYDGGVKMGKAEYAKMKPKAQFLYDTFSKADILDIVISNYLTNHNAVSYYDLDISVKNVYYYRVLKLKHNVRNDLVKILKAVKNYGFYEVFDNGVEMPILMKMYCQNKLYDETMVILNKYMPIFDVLDKNEFYSIVWRGRKDFLLAYEPFVKYDKDEMGLLVDKFKKKLKVIKSGEQK